MRVIVQLLIFCTKFDFVNIFEIIKRFRYTIKRYKDVCKKIINMNAKNIEFLKCRCHRLR